MKFDGCSGKSCCGSDEKTSEEKVVEGNSLYMVLRYFPHNIVPDMVFNTQPI